MPLDSKHIEFCTVSASIPEIVATLDNAITARTPEASQWLHEFVAAEKAGKNRASIIKRVVEALKSWDAGAERPKDTAGIPSVYALDAIKAALESTRERLVAAEDRFADDTLADRLKIGLRCYQAHLAFAVTPGDRAGVGGRGKKTLSRRDGVSFESWLSEEVSWLKRPTAYKYMTAFRGLSLDEKATEEQVEFTLENLRHANQQAGLPAPTLASLVAAATELLAPPAPTPQPPQHQQLTLDDYLATLKAFRQDAEVVVEQAKNMPDHLRKAAAARAYATLAALTGSAWQPADEHDELGQIDPDSITL